MDTSSDKSVKSGLLQGILNLFLETLSIHNNDLGNLKKIFSQLLVTLFMAWSLLGVVVIELLLLLESLISVIWRLLVKGIKNLHIVDNSRKYMAYRKRQEAIRNQENHEEEERLLRLALEQEKLDKKIKFLKNIRNFYDRFRKISRRFCKRNERNRLKMKAFYY